MNLAPSVTAGPVAVLQTRGPPPHPNTACAAPHPPIITPVVALSALFAGPSAGSGSARFSRRPTCPDTSVAGSLPTPPVPRHRKSHSLGNNMMCQLSVVESKSATFPSERARHLLDDSVLEPRSPRRGLALTSSSAVTNGLSLGKRLRPAHDRLVGCRPSVCSVSVSVSLCHAQWRYHSGGPSGPSPPYRGGCLQEPPRARETLVS